ncbi:probable NADH kinase [Juglans microcarpa x Juglans regia]|uniref:probable NADH kinase n=1 Tax=Juglans microcarpa x Juglans regia TaxID=2249226 RepID=UPI001B7EF5E9|nr:probable NADH kinase [Juglans microcarpa x Juglans regia]
MKTQKLELKTWTNSIYNAYMYGCKAPSELARISTYVNSKLLSTYALNDILIAHPCPAALSRVSFKIERDDQPFSPLVYCRSSGLRVSTAAGSTAAMLSAGGFQIPILSQDLQYMVREPISPGAASSLMMHGLIKSDQYIEVAWFCNKGVIYIDGSHVCYPIQNGDTIEVSPKAPIRVVLVSLEIESCFNQRPSHIFQRLLVLSFHIHNGNSKKQGRVYNISSSSSSSFCCCPHSVFNSKLVSLDVTFNIEIKDFDNHELEILGAKNSSGTQQCRFLKIGSLPFGAPTLPNF